MPRKDQAAYRDYQRDLMRRRRSQGSTVEPKPPPDHDAKPPIMPAAASFPFSQQAAPATTPGPASTPGPGPHPEKCFWSDTNVCVLYLTPEEQPMYCNGIKKVCEGKLENIKGLPFGRMWTGFRKHQ
jgi:hypothetical protein